MKYIKRIKDDMIKEHLDNFCAVLIRGPKWCGKSTTAKQFAKSEILLNNNKLKPKYESINANDPSVFLLGDKPRLIDEWQLFPSIWDEIVTYSNETNLRNQFILTGSRVPKNGRVNHSGTMRIARIDLGTMSLFESKESNGTVSLNSLFNNKGYKCKSEAFLSKKNITKVIVRGGFPSTISNEPSNLSLYAKQYVTAICEYDIQESSEKNLSAVTAKAILRSLARNVSELVDNKTIINDVQSSGRAITEPTFYDYYDALLKLFVIDEIPAWCPMIRSKTSIRSLPKKIFFDPSIPCAALDVGVDALNIDFKTRGFLFESMCGRDLKVYADSINGTLSYYRDRLGLECDYVIHLPDGRYGLFECKCGDLYIEKAVDNLNRFNELIEKANYNNTSFKIPLPTVRAIITDEGYAYTRKDGIHIIPISCLKH